MNKPKTLTQMFDISRLTEEDRRFLSSYALQSTLYNASMVQNNHTLFISILSMVLAAIAISFSIERGFTDLMVAVCMVSVLYMIYLIYALYNDNRKVKRIIKNNARDLDALMIYHFRYALKK